MQDEEGPATADEQDVHHLPESDVRVKFSIDDDYPEVPADGQWHHVVRTDHTVWVMKTAPNARHRAARLGTATQGTD